MLKPHPLDELFESTDKIDQFCTNPRILAALQAAKDALLQRQTVSIKVMGPSPAQKARQAFLEHLGLQITPEPEKQNLLI